MLFLAVFLGFIAENIREHYAERKKAREYVESFYEDLKADTARISGYTNFDEEKIQGLGNLGRCYDTVLKNGKGASCLMDVIKNTAVNRPFMWTERTLKQLDNAGGFRLLNKEDADSITSYEKEFNNFQDFQSTVFQRAQDNVRNTFNELGNFKANEPMFRLEAGKIISSETFTNEKVTIPILFSGDRAAINKYFNEVLLYYRVTYNHRRMLLDLKGQQARLIDYFKEKYGYE